MICIDGVNSMTGNAPDIAAFAALAREHDALLYVDDAHGFGVIGERSPDERCDYGVRGNSIVRHAGESYENIVLVGGFSKAYSSLLAFIACPTPLKQVLKTAAPPYLYSGPSPVASLATVLEGLRVNEARGEELRGEAPPPDRGACSTGSTSWASTRPNQSGFPIIEIPLADPDDIDEVGDLLFDRGIYVTMAVYPLVPRDEVGFRLQLTSANTDEQIDHLCEVLGELAERFKLQARGPRAAPMPTPPAATGGRGSPPLWWLYLAFGALVCGLYVFVPPLKGSGPVINGLGLYGVLGVVAGIRIHRPRARLAWWCFAAGLLLFWLGDLYTYSYPKLFGADVPFPSPGDAIYLSVYPVLMLGLVILVRRRNQRADGPGVDRRDDHDAGAGAGLGPPADRPLRARRTLRPDPEARLDRLPDGRHHPARRGHPPGRRRRQAPAGLLPADREHRHAARHRFRLRAVDLHNTYDHQLWMDAGWIFFYLLWGAAALHPRCRSSPSVGTIGSPG